ncbi:hypothetical protein [Delftia phage PhiW-14]|uniref:Uncharacterized protein n=1 Tax=Delftia phage PhiW-14 TaxID=665032 RepID=C9DGF3_BPW14|nr:hypothetical protein DP-phiW-14_gp183 [Delftia phage PhiW-14]ACV50204.1 hypothetical protein [Delftia phage PhiW-14]
MNAYNQIQALIANKYNSKIEEVKTGEAHLIMEGVGIHVSKSGSMVQVAMIYEKRPGAWFQLGDHIILCEKVKGMLGLQMSGARSDIDGMDGVLAYTQDFIAKV